MNSKKNICFRKGCLKQLHGKQRIQYIWDYYKLLIVVCLISLYIIGYTVHGHFSRKEILLYTGLVNVSAGEQLIVCLNSGFTDFMDVSDSGKDLRLYTGLYLTDDPDDPNHEYVYASRIKILASIDSEQLDVVLMDKKAFDAFSQSGYLYNLEELLQKHAPDLLTELEPYLVTNIMIQENDGDALLQDGVSSQEIIAEEFPVGLNISQKGIFKQAGFKDDVYLGVIGNSSRMDMAVEYMKYLYSL